MSRGACCLVVWSRVSVREPHLHASLPSLLPPPAARACCGLLAGSVLPPDTRIDTELRLINKIPPLKFTKSNHFFKKNFGIEDVPRVSDA